MYYNIIGVVGLHLHNMGIMNIFSLSLFCPLYFLASSYWQIWLSQSLSPLFDSIFLWIFIIFAVPSFSVFCALVTPIWCPCILEWLTNTNLVESRGNLSGVSLLQNEKAPNVARYNLNSTRLCRNPGGSQVYQALFILSPLFNEE